MVWECFEIFVDDVGFIEGFTSSGSGKCGYRVTWVEGEDGSGLVVSGLLRCTDKGFVSLRELSRPVGLWQWS